MCIYKQVVKTLKYFQKALKILSNFLRLEKCRDALSTTSRRHHVEVIGSEPVPIAKIDVVSTTINMQNKSGDANGPLI